MVDLHVWYHCAPGTRMQECPTPCTPAAHQQCKKEGSAPRPECGLDRHLLFKIASSLHGYLSHPNCIRLYKDQCCSEQPNGCYSGVHTSLTTKRKIKAQCLA